MKDSTIGANIKRWRDKRGMSQSKLAELIGKTSAAVSQYESGYAIPRMHVIDQIAEALGCTRVDIVDEPVTTGGVDHFALRRMTKAMRRLNAAGQLEACIRVEELGALEKYAKDSESPD
jgi:transcriptional regulator with XRE-family HTH domain